MIVPATLSMLPQLQCCQAAAEVADSRVRILDIVVSTLNQATSSRRWLAAISLCNNSTVPQYRSARAEFGTSERAR